MATDRFEPDRRGLDVTFSSAARGFLLGRLFLGINQIINSARLINRRSPLLALPVECDGQRGCPVAPRSAPPSSIRVERARCRARYAHRRRRNVCTDQSPDMAW